MMEWSKTLYQLTVRVVPFGLSYIDPCAHDTFGIPVV